MAFVARVAAQQMIEIRTAAGTFQVEAAKRVYIATAGGAYIDISPQGVDIGCPGTITVKATQKSMVGPAAVETPMPDLPTSEFCLPCFLRAAQAASPLVPA